MIYDKQRIVHRATKLAYLAKHVGNDVSERTITEIYEQLERLVDAFPRQTTEAPPTVAAYFRHRLHESLEVNDFGMTIESGCGEDCKLEIDIAADFIDRLVLAYHADPAIPLVIPVIRRLTCEEVRKTLLGLI